VKRWASHYTNIHLVENTWQEALSSLGVFDAIFFDDYPLESESQMNSLHEAEVQSSLWVKKSQELLSSVQEMVPTLTEVQYQDSDLLDFLHIQKGSDSISLLNFFNELVLTGQISLQQKERMEKIMLTEGLIAQDQLISKERISPFAFKRKGDRLFTFLEECLTSHMRKGSRFSCFLNDPTSKYEDKLWFDKIITNPFLDYEERRIPVEVPKHCDYYSAKEALVITITKK